MHGHQYIKKINLIIVNSPFEKKNSLIISPLLVLYKDCLLYTSDAADEYADE